MNHEGWIKLYRSLIDWEWYDDHNATRLLVHLLVTVNYEDKKWKGITIKAGSRVTSFSVLAKETGLTVKQIRVALTKLENSGEVARKRAHEGQAVILCKWEKLQSDEEKRARKRADRGHTEGRPRATTKEVKNNKKERTKELRIVKSIEERKSDFVEILRTHIENYPRELLNNFFEYWTEHGPNDKKMRFEKQTSFDISRRLKTWSNNESKFKTNGAKLDRTEQNLVDRSKSANRILKDLLRTSELNQQQGNSEIIDPEQ